MIGWAVEAILASSVLMLLVLALRGPVRRQFGPAVAYALWAIPALRMVLPPLPSHWGAGQVEPLAIASETIALLIVEPAVTAPQSLADAPIAWGGWMAALWVAGAVGFIGWHLIGYARFCARIRASARTCYAVADGRVQVMESDAAAGPMAFGVLRKYVAFPRDFADRYDDMERDLALAHELGHHARGDLIANWIALAMLALHWFNPIAWRAFRAFRADQEMACDALVLGDRPDALRHAYGRAIVKSAHGGAVSAACHLHTINEIKGRLKMLTRHRRATRRQMAGGAVGVTALTLATLGLTASGTQAAERFRDRVEDSIGVRLDDIRLPAPPIAPAIAAPQDLPPPPPAPELPVVPDTATDTGTTTVRWTDDDGNTRVRTVTVQGEPGRLAELRSLKDMPQVEERNCGLGTDARNVIHEGEGGRTRMVICTDRIEAQAERASEMALKSEEFAAQTRIAALASAKASIAAARATIENEPALTPEQRAEALAELDEAIAEIEREGID